MRSITIIENSSKAMRSKGRAGHKSLINRRSFLIIVYFAIFTVFIGCNKDDIQSRIIGKWERQNTEVSGVYGIIITKDTYQRIDEDGENPVCSAKIKRSDIEISCESSTGINTSKYLWSVQDDSILVLGFGRVYHRVDKFSWEEDL